MLQIRKNVFETNSSSMHSLVITKQPRQYTKEELALNYNPEYHRDTFELWRYCDSEDMYYERSPFQILATPLEKLKYYSAYTLGTWKSRPAKKDVDRIKKFIMKQTGITDPAKIFLYKVDRWDRDREKNRDYGTVVNNDSGEDPMHFVERKGIDWEDLILNPKYIIIVDGDEIQNFKDLIKARIINTDNFEDISSGVDYWNDANYTIYTGWLNKWDKEDDDEFVADIDDKTKTIDFKISEQEDVNELNKNKKKVKELIKLAKETKPELKIRFIIDNYTTEVLDVSSIDKSIFEEIVVECDDEQVVGL